MISKGIKLLPTDLVEQLRQFRTKRANEIMRRALGAGARIVARAMAHYAPMDTGLLKKSIGSKEGTSRAQNRSYALAGPRRRMGGYLTHNKGRRRVIKQKGVTPSREMLRRYRNPTRYAALAGIRNPYRDKAATLTRTAVDQAIRETMQRLIAASFKAKYMRPTDG